MSKKPERKKAKRKSASKPKSEVEQVQTSEYGFLTGNEASAFLGGLCPDCRCFRDECRCVDENYSGLE